MRGELSCKTPAPHVRDVLSGFVRHPFESLVARWNWKSAILSAACRGVIFFVTNLGAGFQPAARALLVEFAFRSVASGFFGTMTQALSTAVPRLWADIAALILLPLVAHTCEALVHVLNGTPRLGTSIASSVAFTIVSTLFHLFAMRQGAFIVGEGRGSIFSDLARTPRLIGQFLVECARVVTGRPEKDPRTCRRSRSGTAW
jgi:hypothetical protein